MSSSTAERTRRPPVPGSRAAEAVAEALRRTVPGMPVCRPGSQAYEASRRGNVPDAVTRPDLVVTPRTRREVAAVVGAAGAHRTGVAVMATGHGTHHSPPGGVLLRTHRLDTLVVEPAARVARVGAGVPWSRVLAAAAAHGLVPVAGTAGDVGIVGFTLGGGVGWLSRRYGLGADNLVSAECVLADGTAVTASPESHPDLFWGLRGAGAELAVVTEMTIRLHPVTELHVARAFVTPDRAPALLDAFCDWSPTQPDAMTSTLVLERTEGPPDGPDEVGGVLTVVHVGAHRDAARALAGLWADAGVPDSLHIGTAPAAATGRLGGTRPVGFELLGGVPTPARDLMLTEALPDRAAAPRTRIEVRYWGGVPARDVAGKGPAGHRTVPWSATIDGTSARARRLRRIGTGGTFRNFLADPSRTADAYTAADWRRVTEVRERYDPDGLLRQAPRDR